jgi:hypothetical protein
MAKASQHEATKAAVQREELASIARKESEAKSSIAQEAAEAKARGRSFEAAQSAQIEALRRCRGQYFRGRFH